MGRRRGKIETALQKRQAITSKLLPVCNESVVISYGIVTANIDRIAQTTNNMKKKSQGKSSRRKHNTHHTGNTTTISLHEHHRLHQGHYTLPGNRRQQKKIQSGYTHSKDIKKSAISVEIADFPCLCLLICRFSRFLCYHCIFNVTMQFVNATEIIYLVKERESNT